MSRHSHLKVPERYRDVFVEVLRRYPELTDTRIEVVLKKKHPVPYGTTPTFASLFLPAHKRAYRIVILEDGEPPVEQALFKNLTDDLRKGVIAHEFVHVIQFQRASVPKLWRFVVSYPFPSFERRLERAADKGAIDHGFGEELFKHAAFYPYDSRLCRRKAGRR